jgi:8-oxo-dGTP pyrophosphatase MutT (NUDIX family)
VNDVLPHAPAAIGREFFDRARARLSLDVPAALTDHSITNVIRGDLDLDPVLWEKAGVTASRPAAVLIPVIDHPEPTVLLTLRTGDLSSHAGQIAFPGGKIDAGDASPLAAALREAHEEIGLDASLIDPLPSYTLALSPSEVADAFEVPLAFLMSPENHKRGSRDWKGITRQYYEMPFGERYIWGVTAGILRNLYERIYGNDK